MDNIETLLSVLSPKTRSIAEALLVLHEAEEGVAGIWGAVETEITAKLKEIR